MHTFCRFKIIVCFGVLILTRLIPNQAAAQHKILETQTGQATFYGAAWRGKITASGRKFDDRKAVAAHRTYPFGPFGKNRREGAIIDLSHSVANDLDAVRRGQVAVKLEVLAWGDGRRIRESVANAPERRALR
jgi:rare lipoprotein A (peptidoglycan hydrolase)